MELRTSPRSKVQFRSSFSSAVLVAGEGMVLDLSVHGCRIACRMSVPKGTELELCLYLVEHGQEIPVAIPRAVVQWAERGELGVEFLQLSEGAPERIRRSLRPLEPGPGA